MSSVLSRKQFFYVCHEEQDGALRVFRLCRYGEYLSRESERYAELF